MSTYHSFRFRTAKDGGRATPWPKIVQAGAERLLQVLTFTPLASGTHLKKKRRCSPSTPSARTPARSRGALRSAPPPDNCYSARCPSTSYTCVAFEKKGTDPMVPKQVEQVELMYVGWLEVLRSLAWQELGKAFGGGPNLETIENFY